MTEGDKTRLLAWGHELRSVHTKLRDALRLARDAVRDGGETSTAPHELLLFCHGFCTALTGHHDGEDRTLFPAIAAAHPELRDTLRTLTQDHAMIEHLLGDLRLAVERAASPSALEAHLEGIAAIMESHFRYEERQLLTVLDTLALDADPRDALGPL